MLPEWTIATHFTDLPDPHIDRCKRHDLLAIITVALCGVICGADSFVEIERFGHAKRTWLESVVPLPNGIPSHDTFGRVFAALDPNAFETAFLGWVQTLTTTPDGIVAIDGKPVRRSHDRGHDAPPLHLVSAWAGANHVVLGQVATDAKRNEITAIPALLRTLTLTGTTVTIDAMGCQKAIAKQIVSGGGDSVLALKEHQETLHELVAYHFAQGETTVGWRQLTKDHGRLEIRTCQATADPAILTWLDPTREWRGLGSTAAVTGERWIGETVMWDKRYFVSSLPDVASGRLPRIWHKPAAWR